jgi:hypothetical protein
MAHTFIVGADLFSFADTNWELVKRKLSEPNDSSAAKGGNGEYIPATAKTFNARQEAVLTYRAKVNDAELPVAVSLGLADPVSGYTPTQVTVRPSANGNAEVDITGHKHGVAVHEANQVDVSIDVDGWGATDFLCAAVNEGCQSSQWSASIEHLDKVGRSGEFFCGRSQGCRIEASGQYVSDTAPALAAGWTDDGSAIDEGDDFFAASLKAHQFATPA